MTARLTGLLIAAVWTAGPALAEPVTLGEAVAHALRHDPSLSVAQADIERTDAGVTEARAANRPSAGLQAQVGALETRYPSLTGPTGGQVTASQIPRTVGLQASWDIYTSGAGRAGVMAATHQREAADLQYVATRERVVLQTAEAYSQAWLALRTLEVSQAGVETLTLRLEETSSRFEQGFGTRTDIAINQARVAAAEADREAVRAGRAGAAARLERLTGVSEAEPAAAVTTEPALPADFDSALEAVRAGNAQLQAARAALAASEAGIDAANGQFGPKVTLSARATTGQDQFFFFEDGEITDYGAFATLNVPLYTSGLKSAKTRQARAQRDKAIGELRTVELALRENTAALWGDLQARRLSLQAAQRAERASALASEGARREYQAGLRTLVDALDAEDEYRNAQIRTLQAQTALFLVRARLLALASGLEKALA